MRNKTLICLHGFTHNGQFFDILASKIAESSDWNVICPTFRGRGNEKFDETSNYNYVNYVKSLEEMTAEIENFSILGSSMGGLIAIMYAANNPNKIENLILNDVGAFIKSEALSNVGKYINPNVEFNNEADVLNRLKNEFSESNLSLDELDHLKSIFCEKKYSKI